MKSLIESANKYFDVEIDEAEILEAKRTLKEGHSLWNVIINGRSKLVDALNMQEIIDQMTGNEDFDQASEITFKRMR